LQYLEPATIVTSGLPVFSFVIGCGFDQAVFVGCFMEMPFSEKVCPGACK
jgi:hypothetical protein